MVGFHVPDTLYSIPSWILFVLCLSQDAKDRWLYPHVRDVYI